MHHSFKALGKAILISTFLFTLAYLIVWVSFVLRPYLVEILSWLIPAVLFLSLVFILYTFEVHDLG